MTLIITMLGFVILVGGNQLYWLFVGSAGFLLGNYVAELLGFDQSEWQVITFSVATGLVGIFLAYYLRKIMVVIAGFLAGGYAAVYLPQILGWNAPWQDWMAFALVGLVCAVLIAVWYSMALIVVSTLVGATIILQTITFGAISQEVMFIVLMIFGIAVQWLLMQYAFKPDKE
jgi:hypothetical protein